MTISKHCPTCGSEAILRDAYASWDKDQQKWVLHSYYDETLCDGCGEFFDAGNIIDEPIEVTP